MNRVVVTGIEVMAPGGIGKEKFWQNMSSGKVCTGQVETLNCWDLRIQIAGEVKDFTDETKIESRGGIDPSELERAERMSIVTLGMALKDSKIDPLSLGGKRVGVSVGSTMGRTSPGADKSMDFEVAEDVIKRGENIDAKAIQNVSPSSIITALCKYFGLKGAQTRVFMNACAAGNYSIGWGSDKIKNGDIDVALVGGVDALSLPALVGFNRLLSLTPNVSRPFDKNRKGLIVSEGSAFLVLEDLTRARERDAHIYGEILGYGLGVDAYHITAPRADAAGAIKCMKEALWKSGLKPDDIDYISAHGTGTSLNDKTECKAIVEVFGEKVPPVSSIKSMIGHSLGAAAAIEAVCCLLMIENNRAVPTANFETYDENCPVDCIPNESREMKIDNVLSNAFAFGGNNSCLAISRFKGGEADE